MLSAILTAFQDKGSSVDTFQYGGWAGWSFMKYSAYVRRIVADFSHVPPNEYSPSPNDKKQWSLENFEDIFSFGSALEDIIYVVFVQEPNETFNEAWERFKGLLHQCHHHGFSELHQLDTFYNSLSSNDQDALDSAAGGNFLNKMPQEGLAIIESKSKVRYSRSRANDSRVSTDAPLSASLPSNNSFDIQQLADDY
ncbi:hypothetical protein Tco_0014141 [Tanacetum coccineum]